MRRREFITLLGGAAAAWPLAARAQQPAMPVIGFLSAGSPEAHRDHSSPHSAKGWAKLAMSKARTLRSNTAGRTVETDRLPALAADLVRRQVTVIVGDRRRRPALAAKAATTTIPIVFATGERPGRGWSCRQPQPAGRQRHRHHLHEYGACGKAARAFAGTLAPRRALCGLGQS